jgi:hypothetical protein
MPDPKHQLDLPFVFEPPDPRPKPDKRQVIVVKPKPPESEAPTHTPQGVSAA